jgi:hypothetical protein
VYALGSNPVERARLERQAVITVGGDDWLER